MQGLWGVVGHKIGVIIITINLIFTICIYSFTYALMRKERNKYLNET